MKELDWTGERYLPQIKGQIALEHIHRYLIVKELVIGKDVLDIASGEGYGSAMLANLARSVIGVDIEPEAIAHAKRKYIKPNLHFKEGDCSNIPLDNASVDVVVSYETIEHHDQHQEMMLEIKRVLRPNGLLIISSPDKHEYSDVPNYSNPFHVKELYAQEFLSLVESHFQHITVYGQRVIYGSGIFAEKNSTHFKTYKFDQEDIQLAEGLARPLYNIAIASDVEIKELPHSFLEQSISESEHLIHAQAVIANLRHEANAKEEQIQNVSQFVSLKEEQIKSLGLVATIKEEQIKNLGLILDLKEDQIKRSEEKIRALHQDLTDKLDRVIEINQAAISKDEKINTFEQVMAFSEKQINTMGLSLKDKDEHIDRLNQHITELRKQADSILNSQFWRLTKPLRVIVYPIKKALFALYQSERVIS